MNRQLTTGLAVITAMLAWCAATEPAWAQGNAKADTAPGGPPKQQSDYERLLTGTKTQEGLFRVHVKEQNLYVEIPQHLLDREMIWPVAISRGSPDAGLIGGMTLNFDNDWVMVFKKVGEDQIHLVRKNVRVRAKAGTPTAFAVERAYTDSVVAGLRVITKAPNGAMVVDFAELMINFDLAGLADQLPGYFMDPRLSTFHKVKAFPENLEIQVAAVYRTGRPFFQLNTVPDNRSLTAHVHYSISLLPQNTGFQPRLADDRVGYFLTAVKDFTRDAGDTSFVRYVNRWNLEKSDPAAKLSVPKKPIRFWIERSVPLEYRKYVREGILEWNKAFEAIGFQDAIEVRQQDEEDDFDPEDIRYNTVRWITADAGFAIGPSRVNPHTGEILDADILFDASMVRFEREEYQILTADPLKLLEWKPSQRDLPAGLKRAEGLPTERANCRCRHCGMSNGLKREMLIGLAGLQLHGMWKPGDPVPMELIGQSIKHTVMHEVGHTLGLRHNFKASSILSLEAINNPNNAGKATVGSVMDYVPVNIQPKGKPQGAFFPPTIGPYDMWAIEYGYHPEEGKLKEIAAKAAKPELAYATDEDTYRSDSDALSNTWDLGDDPMAYGQRRIELLSQLLENLPDRVVANGEGWQPTRKALAMLIMAHARTAAYSASLVGGHFSHRDHKGDPNGRAPVVMVDAARQRAALKYLRENVFSEAPIKLSPELVSRLARSRWEHWGADSFGGDLMFPLHDYVLMTQQAAMYQMLSMSNLTRMYEGEKTVPAGADYVTVAELLRSLTDGVWTDALAELPDRAFSDRAPLLSSFRRGLQREHAAVLISLATYSGSGLPPDVRSLARLQLRRILALIDIELPARVKAAGRKNTQLDDVSDAHLFDLRERIKKVLDATVTVRP